MKRVLSLLLLAAPVLPAAAQVLPLVAPPQAKPVLVTGGTVHVGDGRVIANGRVLFDGGKIVQVGEASATHALDAQAERIDASGQHVYPGLIALNTQLGLSEVSLGLNAREDHNERSNASNPNVRAIVAYDTDSHIPPTVRSAGVLLAETTPDGEGISGQSAIVQLDAWNWEDAAYAPDNALHVQWPTMQAYAPADDAAKRKEALERIRKAVDDLHETFTQAREYAAARAARTPTRGVDLRLEALLPYVRGEKPVFVHADELRQIEAAVAFAQRHRLKLVLVGGYDAWRVPELLKRHQVPVVYLTTHQLPGRPDEDADLPYRIPKLLADAGVDFCLAHGGYWQHRNLPFQAGTAAAYGLDRERALQAVTLDAARIAGIAARTGSLTEGKDANLIISAGDVLDMRSSRVSHAWIQGRRIDLDNKQRELYRRFQQKYEQQRAAGQGR